MIRKMLRSFLIIVLTLFLLVHLTACGKSQGVKQVEQAIADIGTVTLSSEQEIQNAEDMYEMLTDKEKEKVENRFDLIDARNELEGLKRAEEQRKVEEERRKAMTELSLLKNGLETAKSKLEFTKKYAGNVNGKGSRKFADEFVAELRNCLNDVNVDLIAASFPDVARKIPSVKQNCGEVCDLLDEMGRTNSSSYVSSIKSKASSTLTQVQDLLDDIARLN